MNAAAAARVGPEGRTEVRYIGYYATYGCPAVRRAMHEALGERRKLQRALLRDAACVFQWSERSKVCWKRVMGGSIVGSSYFINGALARKVDLMESIRHFITRYCDDGMVGHDSDARIAASCLLEFCVARGSETLTRLLEAS